MKTICVLGLGYIGLPTASIFATKGFRVTGVDVNPNILKIIGNGDIHIEEPDLDVIVRSAVFSGNLKVSALPVESDVFIIAVPTPLLPDKKPNLSFVVKATDAIIPVIKKGALVILESTSPVGTTESIVASRIARAKGWQVGEDFYAAHCPERVLPGKILKELVDNDRVIGGINQKSAELAKELYCTIVGGSIFLTDCSTAEMVKLVENAYRDVNIAYANELSMICEHLGIKVWDVIELANRHPRVNILQPGPGVGGHCIAVDPWFIVDSAPLQADLIRTARHVNDLKPHFIVDKVKQQAEKFKSPVIGCLGLTYKNDVDDLRESPALEIVRGIIKEQLGEVLVCEPFVKEFPEFPLYPIETVLEKSDILVMLVNHRQFCDMDMEVLKEKIVIDTRGIWRNL